MATLQSVKQLAEASLALAASGSGGSGSGKPGKNCTIQKTEPIDGGTRVTFAWTADDGSVKTTSVNVMNGEKGADGANCKIKSIEQYGTLDSEGNWKQGHKIEFEWVAEDGTTQTDSMIVMDGEKGAAGEQGEPGEDGVSPVISVSVIPGGHRVAITDATHTETFDVMDGDGGQAESIDWSKITNKPDDLATTGDVDKKVFIAEYNVTTAQEIIAYLDSSKEPFAPMLVKRGTDYYTVITTAKQADNKIIIRTFATLSGVFYIFTYTITNATWANSNYGVQKALVSGTDIKTVNGESLLGNGDIVVSGSSDYADLSNKPKINGVALDGDKSAADLGITAYDDTALVARVAELEKKLADYAEVTLKMSDGTNEVDKLILAKDKPTPQRTMFDLEEGLYDAEGNKIAELDAPGSGLINLDDGAGGHSDIWLFDEDEENKTIDYSGISFMGRSIRGFGVTWPVDWIVFPDSAGRDGVLPVETGNNNPRWGKDPTIVYYKGNSEPDLIGATLDTTGLPLYWERQPQRTMFDLQDGFYDAEGNFLGGADCVSEEYAGDTPKDIYDYAINMGDLGQTPPPIGAVGLALNRFETADALHRLSLFVTEARYPLDWVALGDMDLDVLNPLVMDSEGVELPNAIGTIYYKGNSVNKTLGTNATIDTVGKIPWEG